MRFLPTREMIAQSWQKYGLIVVGNIVFFVLLYFVSYRPNNDEHRAAELLSMAQEQENRGQGDAAAVLYGKVVERYPGTDAAETAGALLPSLRKRLAARGASGNAPGAAPCIDVADVLAKRPSLFLAAHLAERYGEDPALKPQLRRAIADYLGIAARFDGVPLTEIRKEKAFAAPELAQELFAVKPACVMTPDLVYDDFAVRNDNFFPWTDVKVRLGVRQGDAAVEEEAHFDAVLPGAALDLAELHVKKGAGVVSCAVAVESAEGPGTWSGAL